ncbi:MAG: OmpH family outer membrane protein [Shimia sp.]|uniref:OmpH family outer membrane protein n=1 Tax=Shimia sp. TaxID=1954381 RepID=UPI001B11CF10|nr:OmpH family outer membrane protein [Shimia sp.]MBO6897417.1 OmpH family outer membrane protein [Shimia sp.]
MGRRVLRLVLLAGALWSAPFAWAQDIQLPQSPILTVDSEALFSQSTFGRQVAQELAAEESVLLAENRRIQAELTEEERVLTEKRSEMEPDAFRAVAEAFDARVVQIRNEQDAKAANLEQRRLQEQEAFIRVASPILTKLMQDAGASVILERREVLLGDPAVDVTAIAIERLNKALGDGAVSDAVPEDE